MFLGQIRGGCKGALTTLPPTTPPQDGDPELACLSPDLLPAAPEGSDGDDQRNEGANDGDIPTSGRGGGRRGGGGRLREVVLACSLPCSLLSALVPEGDKSHSGGDGSGSGAPGTSLVVLREKHLRALGGARPRPPSDSAGAAGALGGGGGDGGGVPVLPETALLLPGSCILRAFQLCAAPAAPGFDPDEVATSRPVLPEARRASIASVALAAMATVTELTPVLAISDYARVKSTSSCCC